METCQLALEAFVKTPIFFVVPVLLLAFVMWSPWSPSRFYHHHDHEHLDGHSAVAAEAGPEPL